MSCIFLGNVLPSILRFEKILFEIDSLICSLKFAQKLEYVAT